MRVFLVLVLLARTAAAASPVASVGLDEHVGARIPASLAFSDSTGRPVTLARYLDGKRPVVLVMAYARCTMLCSVVLRGVADAVRAGPMSVGRDYVAVVVSLDPKETIDEAARRQNRLLENAGVSGNREAWPYLVGDQSSIRALANVLGFHYAWDAQTKQFAHPAVVFVLTPDGRIAEYVRGVTFDGLSDAIERARAGQITSSKARDLLACFHFDPALRRYGARIAWLYRLGAGMVLLMLAGLVVGLITWERRRQP
jgi:protein SCO1